MSLVFTAWMEPQYIFLHPLTLLCLHKVHPLPPSLSKGTIGVFLDVLFYPFLRAESFRQRDQRLLNLPDSEPSYREGVGAQDYDYAMSILHNDYRVN